MHISTPKQALRCRSPIDKVLAPEFFKALSDPTRSSLLACLAKCGRACSVSEMAECCSVDPSVVSRHLSVLARAGILSQRKEGRTVFYQVRFREIAALFRSAAEAFEACARDSASGCC